VRTEQLLRHLADAEPISGEALARELGVTRAAVWKGVSKLKARGLGIEAIPGRGYRLDRPIDLLDRAVIEARLDERASRHVERIDLFTEIGSTNDHLLRTPETRANRMTVCLAEYQNAGRGRRGRGWTAPLGGGLCLSVGWRYAEMPGDISALSLAVGVVARRVIGALAGAEIALKWPNDLVYDDRKLGGILIEISAEAHGGCYIVAGLGLNVSVPTAQLAAVSDWPRGAVDLAGATGGRQPARSELAAALIAGLAELFADYGTTGFAPYREEWSGAHMLDGREVCLIELSGESRGTVRGIDADGALILDTDSGRRRVVAGDISLRVES
jgi:BirA family biotin operon repressor/biotin-[acetyl-CoA-carboxylase] ligase